MGEWFTESFGEDYKIVYRHRNRANAEQEIASMMKWMDLRENASVLDVGCGTGRHAQALTSLGYQVTGLDLSEVLLSEARRCDDEDQIVLVQGDMRKLPFGNATFDATVNLFTSFGYFDDFNDNMIVLEELKRVLKPDGRFLIDFLNPTYLISHLVPESTRMDEPTGLLITEKRSIEGDFVVKKIEVKPHDDPTNQAHRADPREGSRYYKECVRLISLEQFESMLMKAGLVLDNVYGDYDGSKYESATSERLILLGSQPR